MITIRHQIELETVFLVTMAIGLGLIFGMYRNDYQPQFKITSGVPSFMLVSTKVISPKVSISSQISPNGIKKVIMKVTENSDNTVTYDFSTANANGANEKLIFTEILDSSKTMTIPFNTWSPDNRYLFIQENSGSSKHIFLFNADGTQFEQGEIYLDVTDLFKKQNTGYKFNETTGWASETLIIINTTKQNDAKGPSYWFEVPSRQIIQLSTEF